MQVLQFQIFMGAVACSTTKTPRADQSDNGLNGQALEQQQWCGRIKLLKPDQIRHIHQQIEKSQDSLAVTRGTLKRVLHIEDLEVENVFKKFDRTQSGYVDTYELMSAIIFLSQSTFEEKAQLLFGMYDTNMSTTLELDELTILIKNALTSLMAIENKKAPNMKEIELRTRDFFTRADEDRNNVISFKEFKSYLRKEKFVVEAILKFGVADPAELGNDFGNGANGLPEIHEDLDAECNPTHQLTKRQQAVRQEITADEFAEEDLGQGDQFMAVKPWLGVIKNSVPSNYKPSKSDYLGPDATLELEYVFGYRCHDTRNNLRFANDGKLVYHTAGVGIVMDTQTNTQKFFRDHKSDILCLAVNPAGTICVTGEAQSHLCVWDIQTQTLIEKVSKPMKKGIRHVAFSPDGCFIAASDMTDDHVCTIFQLLPQKDKSGKMLIQVATGNGGKANVMSLGFNATGDQVVATCVKDVLFYSWSNGKIAIKKGSGWGTGTQAADTILSQAVVGGTVFTGNVAGEIISWNGLSIGKRTKAHEQKVNCLYAGTNRLISGGGDGLVYTWVVQGGALTREKTFSLKGEEINSAIPAAISVCEKDGRLLAGTRGGEIVEFQLTTTKTNVYMRSHYDDELWGLAVHPTRSEIYTWGRDCMLGVWDLKQRKQIHYTKLDSGGDVLAFSPDGSLLVLGFLNGSFIVLDANLKITTKRRDRAGKAIQVIKFSPDGSICAQGGHDQLIITYDVNKNFAPLKKIRKHSSTIKFLDFSLDGMTFQSLCQAYEILYFDVQSGKQVTNGASEFKDEKWSTWTLSLGWPVQGIFPPLADGSDINAVERSTDHTIVATGDDFSKVKLFRYPNPIEKAPFSEFTGHSSHVTNVSFSRNQFGQKYLLSTGGRDKAIFSWKYIKSGAIVQQEPLAREKQTTQKTQRSEASTTVNSITTQKKSATQQPTQVPVQLQKSQRESPPLRDDISDDLEREPIQKSQRPRTAAPQRAFQLEHESSIRRRPTSSMSRITQEEDERDLHPAEFAEYQAEGDEAGATKPYVGTIVAMTPKGFKMPTQPQAPPKQNLTLKWAHGFRSFDTSGNLKYVGSGNNFVFTTAGVGVVQNPQAKTQKFFNQHKEDIVSMAYNRQANVVATGQMASKELNEAASNKKLAANTVDAAKSKVASKEGKLVDIMIWDAETCELICKLPLVLRRAVRQLHFSPDGNLLLGVGQDDQSTAVVFDWKNKKKLSEVKCQPIDKNRPDETVISAAWKEDGTTFATCGPKHLKTFSKEGKNLTNSSVTELKAWITTVNFVLGGKLLTGTSDGELIEWNGLTPIGKPVLAHDKGCRVFCIERAQDFVSGFFTGGNDGKVFQWNGQMQKTLKVDLKSLNLIEPGIKSLDFKQGETFLCGTYGSQIVEVTPQGHQVLVSGHYKDTTLPKWDYPEIWGCATHPTQQIFASAGGDRRVRIWDMNQMLRVSEAFDRDITSLAWSPDGKIIACGDRESKVRTLDAQTLAQIDVKDTHVVPKMKQVGTQWIEDIKFSPDGSQIAFGHHGYQSKLEVLKIDKKGKITGLRKGMMMSSALMDLDWSQSGEHVIVTNQSYEILIFNVKTGVIEHDKRPSGHVDTQWQTCTQRLGFPVQGIWPGIDLTDINTVDRSKNSVVLATGDDFGMVKLFKYPCVTPKAKFNEYCGHSSHVTKVRFSANDENLVSTGGNDMTVFIWDTDINGPDGVFIKEWEANDNNPDDPSLEIKVDKSKGKIKAAEREEKESRKTQAYDTEQDEFKEADMGPGDEFLAVLPWKGQMKPPTSYTKSSSKDGTAPAIDLKLEWVHGYRGSNTRNNLQFVNNGSVAYFAAGLGVVYDPNTHTQKFFDAHGDDVTAIAFSPDGKLVASGENGKRPYVYIWDSETMEKKFALRDNGIKGNIQALAYSPSGKILGVVDMSDDHNIGLYDTASGACLVSSKGDRACVLDIAFQSDDTFVTAGVKHFKQYNFDGSRLRAKLGNFGGLDQRIGSCEFSGNDCLTGSINGDLYKWNGTTVAVAYNKLHTRMIDAITVTESLIFTGGRDSQINALSKQYQKLFTINLSLVKNSVNTQVRAITLNQGQDCLMIGTFGHEIIKCPIQIKTGQQTSEPEVLIHGHYAPATMLNNEAWGLSVFKNKNLYITSSDDGTLRIWDTNTRRQFAMLATNTDMQDKQLANQKDGTLPEAAMGRAIDISYDGKYIAVGMRDGSVRIYEGSQNTWKLVALPKVGKLKKSEWVEDLKFSPDNKYLVVSSHDNFLYLFDVPNFQKESKRFGVSSSFITHLDWSIGSDVIRTNDGSYELLYYSVPDGKQNKSGASAYRDTDWATNSCVLGWAVQGIWQQGMDGSDINHANRSNKPVNGHQLLATADDFGKVSIYRYPCPVERAQSVQGKGHSSHVTKVHFNSTDQYLYSVGGNDTTVMQWKVSAGNGVAVTAKGKVNKKL